MFARFGKALQITKDSRQAGRLSRSSAVSSQCCHERLLVQSAVLQADGPVIVPPLSNPLSYLCPIKS